MSERSQEGIKEHLERQDVQERLRKSMQNAHDNATVTISRAAHLFGFTEAQLREWEKRGLLRTARPLTSQDGRSTTGHRQYSPNELDKLAIIRELLNQGYTPGEIPPDVDEMWQATESERQDQRTEPAFHETKHVHLEQRVEQADREVFWRYFVSQALRLSILLLCEDMPDTIALLVLPLQKKDAYKSVRSPDDLAKIGEVLVGWLTDNSSFYTVLDANPSFEFPSDFRVEQLVATEEDRYQHNTFLVLQRKARSPLLIKSLVKTIRRLLAPIYEYVDDWRGCFDYGPRDWMYQVVDFSRPNPYDNALNRLADMVVRLGGKTASGEDKWRFCCFFLPKGPTLPLQQRSLVVRAQSGGSPHVVGRTVLSAKAPGLSLKAFQSGHIIYRPEISPEDAIIAYHDEEEPIGSAIAIPVRGEDGLSIAVIYIVSAEICAFSIDDQRLLRIVSRMVEELLQTYQARQQLTGRLTDLIANPGVVDTSFRNFESEDEFINDLDALLSSIKEKMEPWEKPVTLAPLPLPERAARFREDQKSGVVSYIAIDIDDQSSRAARYSDRVTGIWLEKSVRVYLGRLASFEKYSSRKLYHVYADRFYLLLEGIPLEEAQVLAEQLRQALKGDYRFYVRDNTTERPLLPSSMLELNDVTVRVGVSAYPYLKLQELLKRYPAPTAVPVVRNLFIDAVDKELDLGQRQGGDVVISWVS